MAARIIAGGKPITADDINTVLKHQNIVVTDDELKELLSVAGVDFGTFARKDQLNSSIPNVTKPRTKLSPVQPITLHGVYCWTNIETNVLYFGSSIDLGSRVRDYFTVYTKLDGLRPILADIQTYGIENFSLKVWTLPPHLATVTNIIILEQFFILSNDLSNNSLLIANASPGGK